MSPDGTQLFRAGQILPGTMKTDWLNDALRQGFVEVARDPTAETRAENPGVVTPPVLKANDQSKDDKATTTPAPVNLGSGGPAGVTVKVTDPTRPAEPKAAQGIWNLDPAALQGRDIANLNVLVKERDPSVAEFTTVEEAIAWLSQDFKSN